jgi:hypothetical protein
MQANTSTNRVAHMLLSVGGCGGRKLLIAKPNGTSATGSTIRVVVHFIARGTRVRRRS